MTTYNPAEVDRLIAEARAHDAASGYHDNSEWIRSNLGTMADQLAAARSDVTSAHAALTRTGVPLDLPLAERIEWLARQRPIWDGADQLAAAKAEVARLTAALPNWSHAEALQQRDALIAAGVAAQTKIRQLHADIALADQTAKVQAGHIAELREALSDALADLLGYRGEYDTTRKIETLLAEAGGSKETP